jgi:hypothetical protein
MDSPARWWRVARCTECRKVDEGYTRSIFADVDDIDLRDPEIGNIHTCKWCEWEHNNRRTHGL